MKIVNIIPGLYACGAIDSWDAVANIIPDYVVNLAGEKGYADGVEPDGLKLPVFMHWHIDDAAVLPDKSILRDLAKFLAKRIKKDDAQVLVHDHSGNNRSYLMVAAILWYLKYGDGAELYTLIKARHKTALTNSTFRDYIRYWNAK